MTEKKKKRKTIKKDANYKTLYKADPPDPGQVAAIIDLLEKNYSGAGTALNYRNPYELLIAVILSAQCTDEMVNRVIVPLFRKYPDARSLSEASQEDVEKIIHSTGFFRNKAKNIIAAAGILHLKHRGQPPKTMDEMLQIPGVARKTANVVLGQGYGITSGLAVDTHVKRLSRRFGFHDLNDPVKIERCLMEIIPKNKWIDFTSQVILHGRKICPARKPLCEVCQLSKYCREGQDQLKKAS